MGTLLIFAMYILLKLISSVLDKDRELETAKAMGPYRVNYISDESISNIPLRVRYKHVLRIGIVTPASIENGRATCCADAELTRRQEYVDVKLIEVASAVHYLNDYYAYSAYLN